MSKYNFYVGGDNGGISIEALLNKHGGVKGARRFMRDELVLVEAVPNPTLVRILENESTVFDACDGTRTMANAKDVFTGWVDGDWKNYGLCNPGPATPATPAIMYELAKDEWFMGIFMSIGLPHLDAMCVTESQYIGFAEKYPHLLGDYGAFMLVKKDWNKPAMQLIDGVKNFDNVFVAYARRCSGGLNSTVDYFEFGRVWRADSRRRVVVPQLTI